MTMRHLMASSAGFAFGPAFGSTNPKVDEMYAKADLWSGTNDDIIPKLAPDGRYPCESPEFPPRACREPSGFDVLDSPSGVVEDTDADIVGAQEPVLVPVRVAWDGIGRAYDRLNLRPSHPRSNPTHIRVCEPPADAGKMEEQRHPEHEEHEPPNCEARLRHCPLL
jgi:hypothetical protein